LLGLRLNLFNCYKVPHGPSEALNLVARRNSQSDTIAMYAGLVTVLLQDFLSLGFLTSLRACGELQRKVGVIPYQSSAQCMRGSCA
jgi:hypothetical protein